MNDAIRDGHVKKPWPEAAVNHRIEGSYTPQHNGTDMEPTNIHAITKGEYQGIGMFSGGKGMKKGMKKMPGGNSGNGNL